MSALVRIITLPDPSRAIYTFHKHEGMVICLDHLREMRYSFDPSFVEISHELATFMGYSCLMCGVTPSEGKLCENEDCREPLHAQWPAVYCCNDCALGDS